uniref:Uncharacterized protein n=1 Tax=Panagrolaimus sp. JU765 TaxID=591449 RepID=A0AC34R240_9BILA
MLDVLDLEKARTGNETLVGGFDLLVKNNETVYKPTAPSNSAISGNGTIPGMFVPTMNVRIGDYVPLLHMP